MAYKKRSKGMSDLEATLNKIIFDSMKIIAKNAETELKDHVEEDVYRSMKPKSYIRTKELKKSVQKNVYQSGSVTSAEIYHDPKMMKAVAPYRGNNYMGQHHSTVRSYSPQEYSEFLPRVINDGRSGHIFGIGAWTQPRPYFTNAEKYVFKNFKKDLKEQLVKRGLKVTK